MQENEPWSEKYLKAAEDWADKENAAQLLDDMKSAVMAQKQAALGDMPVNRAEQVVKASPEWEKYIESCVKARYEANIAKGRLAYLKMKYGEWQSAEANNRAEARL